jgi:ABC-2 type transport system permease protein
MGIILPPAFDGAVRENSETDITLFFWGEGLIADRATLITALARAIGTVSGRSALVSVEPVAMGNAEIVSWSERLLPLLVLMTIMLGGTLVPAVSLVDEKQKRTLQALTITPTSLGEVLVSKALLGTGVSLVMGIIILTLNQAFGAQPLLLILVLALGALVAAQLGILLGTLSKDITSLFTVVKSLAILLYAPAIIELVPQLPQWLARIFPTYYIIAPIQEIALNGAQWTEVASQVLILSALAAAMLVGLAGMVRGNVMSNE